MFNFLKNNQGSMLMEIIVSISIIALLSTISIPYIRKYQPNLKLNGAARELATDLRYAQQLTITEQKIHQVVFNLNNNEYQILKIDGATTTIKTIELESEINFKEITGLIDNKVIFNYYGGTVNSGQIILSNINNLTQTINIKPSGYIQLE